jgi:hypothetical protein
MVPAFYIPRNVNQFVNHRDVETGGWPLDQRLSHWEVWRFLRSLAGMVGYPANLEIFKKSS